MVVWRVEAEVPEVDEDLVGTARGHTKVPGLFGSLLGTAGPYPGSGVFVSWTRMPFFQCTTLLVYQNPMQKRSPPPQRHPGLRTASLSELGLFSP